MSEYDKQQWQAEQAARDAALQVQRDKEKKARERSARNAARKLERLHRTLKESGEISEFEDEFADSVAERLEKYGTAFHDLEKGRPGDALSFAQKRVVAGMNKKAKDARRAKQRQALGKDAPPEDEPERKPRYSSFKSKGKAKWTPRVRQLDEEWDDGPATPEPERPPVAEPALRTVDVPPEPAPEPPRPPVGKPFLRVISNDAPSSGE